MKITRELYLKFRHDFGNELYQQRLKRGWSLAQAAEELKLGNPNVLYKIEKGTSKRFFLFFAIAAFYGCRLQLKLLS